MKGLPLVSIEVLKIIMGQLENQNVKGTKEYGTTIDEVEYTKYDWNLMALEELIDCTQYLMKENMRLNKIIDVLKEEI